VVAVSNERFKLEGSVEEEEKMRNLRLSGTGNKLGRQPHFLRPEGQELGKNMPV